MNFLDSLRAATTVHQLAPLLGFTPAGLTYILYVKPSSEKYREFEIPKKVGGTRTICAPTNELKLLQRNLATLLQDCLEEIEAAQGRDDKGSKPDRLAHGFKRRRSIVTNAKRHRHRRFVFNIDIADFFGSINFGRVRGFFISDKNFHLNPKVATLIAQIACHNNVLPQGSPCSPVISNLIGHILDIHLVRLAGKTGCIYSRYADDLTFSTNDRNFPTQIATCIDPEHHNWTAGNEVSYIIKRSGFSLNTSKTRMQYRNSRQVVTGLVTNNIVNVRSEYWRTARAMVHTLIRTGEFYLIHMVADSLGQLNEEKQVGKPEQLAGMLYFIHQVDHLSSQGFSKSKTEILRRFLIFDRFYRAKQTTLVCEGKTDNVYLTHAIRSLAKEFPQLATISEAGSVEINVSKFRYKGRSTNRVLKLNGGAADLGHFLRLYCAETKKFTAPGMEWPVIVLIDNDSGSKPIYSTIKQLTNQKPTGTERYIHVRHNLYVVATPPIGGSYESKIEDLFTTKTLATLLGGRVFNTSNDYDRKLEYGKADFAYKVVARKATSIDFSGFRPLLERIAEVVDYHRSKVEPPPAEKTL